jgi:soluble P-type ATPase
VLLDIPGRQNIEIKNVFLDYNGTLAVDGVLMEGVKVYINELAHLVNFHVVTADTHGTAEKQLSHVNCHVINLSSHSKYKNKLDYLYYLGAENTLCVGNGFNDAGVLERSALGIALIQKEGLNTSALLASDLVFTSIQDVFNGLKHPKRLIATLRL